MFKIILILRWLYHLVPPAIPFHLQIFLSHVRSLLLHLQLPIRFLLMVYPPLFIRITFLLVYTLGLGSDQVQHSKCIIEYVLLDQQIQFTISVEGWSVVDFNQLRFQVTVEHDVKSQDLKAHIAVDVVGLA